MRILFTGFTSRTVGSEYNVYDYVCTVDVLREALERAGHEVDCRVVSAETDPVVEEDYDCALVGVGAVNGLSSRYKVSGLWTLARFGKRAGIFPSDGKNVYTFPNSVQTCINGQHALDSTPISPLDYMFGVLQRERNNVIEQEFARRPELIPVWLSVLNALPHLEGPRRCNYPVLIPAHAWGQSYIYTRHFGSPCTLWDPSAMVLEKQFPADTRAPDGRQVHCHTALASERQRAWLCPSLQDNANWLKKVKPTWPVVEIGNKRKAREGKGLPYMPEMELINQHYPKYWGSLSFTYPLAEGGWWRARYIHAPLCGMVTCADEADALRMPDPFKHATRFLVEKASDERLTEIALDQWTAVRDTMWSVDKAVGTVDEFVTRLTDAGR